MSTIMHIIAHSLRSKLTSLAAFALAAFAFGGVASANEHMLILIDQSGSMYDTSVGGAPRWIVARQLAADAVSAAAPNREYALWTFQNTNFTSVVPFSAGASAASIVTAIWALPNPGGATPLAGSICDAVNELIAYKPTEFHQKRIELFSDGLENNTPTTNECYGPSSADHQHPDLYSWEWKVFNKVRTGSATSSALPPIPLIVNADTLFENEGAFAFAFAASATAAAPSARVVKTTVPRKPEQQIDISQLPIKEIASLPELEQMRVVEKLKIATPSSLIRSQLLEGVVVSKQISQSPATEFTNTMGFYQALTAQAGNGGRFRVFSSTTPRLPQLGDVTGDYCVDDDDIDAVVANWGATVAAGNMLDPNQDKVIDYYDYMTVLQNYDEGCSN